MNDNLIKYTYKYSDEFTQICQPIFDQSPVTFLCVSRVFNDGTYTSFMSDPMWTDHYIKNHCEPTISLWIEDKIKLADKGHSIWSLSDFFDTNTDTKNLLNDCNLFNYNNGINITDRYPDYYDITTFASPLTDGIERFFIEKQDILRNYILYVKEKIFSDHVLANEFKIHYEIPRLASDANIQDLSANCGIKINKYYLGYPLKEGEYLTQGEIDCLLQFIIGVPISRISEKLRISKRTIEINLENIKSKCAMMSASNFRLFFLKNRYISALIGKPKEINQDRIKLTNRQTDCARLLLEGFQYNEIASRLKLSTRSIEFYVENLKAKLDCRNKSELIIKLTPLIHRT